MFSPYQTYNQFKGILVCSQTDQGGANILAVTFKGFGIGVKFVTGSKPEDFIPAIDERTKAIFVESISNPMYHVSDIPALAKVGFFYFRIWLMLTSQRSPMITASL